VIVSDVELTSLLKDQSQLTAMVMGMELRSNITSDASGRRNASSLFRRPPRITL
jgi:hypothetical protein